MARRDPAGRTNRPKTDRQQDWALALILQLGLWVCRATACFVHWGEGPESRGGEGMASRLRRENVLAFNCSKGREGKTGLEEILWLDGRTNGKEYGNTAFQTLPGSRLNPTAHPAQGVPPASPHSRGSHRVQSRNPGLPGSWGEGRASRLRRPLTHLPLFPEPLPAVPLSTPARTPEGTPSWERELEEV